SIDVGSSLTVPTNAPLKLDDAVLNIQAGAAANISGLPSQVTLGLKGTVITNNGQFFLNNRAGMFATTGGRSPFNNKASAGFPATGDNTVDGLDGARLLFNSPGPIRCLNCLLTFGTGVAWTSSSGSVSFETDLGLIILKGLDVPSWVTFLFGGSGTNRPGSP